MIDVSNAAAVRAEAERRAARRAQGLPYSPTPEEIEQQERESDSRLEKEIQRDVVRLYRAHGCVVYETSQKRAAKVTAGIPDLIVFHPRSHTMLFHEVKTATGKLRPDQAGFLEQCLLTNTIHVVGGVVAAQLAIDTFLLPIHPRG